jgi:hypothetical protein
MNALKLVKIYFLKHYYQFIFNISVLLIKAVKFLGIQRSKTLY